MRYPIIINPHPALRRRAEPVFYIDDEIVQLLEDMKETMIAHDGVGLAAPQIGKNLQLAVVEVDEDETLELINPRIIEKSGTSIDVEGCLSIPGVYGTVERSDQITIQYFDRDGDELEAQAEDYLARAIQHEIDHLHGVLFTDKIIEEIPEAELEKYMEEHEDD